MKLLWSEARKSAAFGDLLRAAQRGPAGSPAGEASAAGRASPGRGPGRSSPGVSVEPGTMVLTRIAAAVSSAAQVRAKDRTAALDAAYTPNAGVPRAAAVDPVEDDRGAVVQQRQRLLHREQRALDVGAEGAVEVLLGDLLQGGELAAAGVGEQHVERRRRGAIASYEPVEVGRGRRRRRGHRWRWGRSRPRPRRARPYGGR